jgi:hypothetical protein
MVGGNSIRSAIPMPSNIIAIADGVGVVLPPWGDNSRLSICIVVCMSLVRGRTSALLVVFTDKGGLRCEFVTWKSFWYL